MRKSIKRHLDTNHPLEQQNTEAYEAYMAEVSLLSHHRDVTKISPPILSVLKFHVSNDTSTAGLQLRIASST
jgi:hypothetical protein